MAKWGELGWNTREVVKWFWLCEGEGGKWFWQGQTWVWPVSNISKGSGLEDWAKGIGWIRVWFSLDLFVGFKLKNHKDHLCNFLQFEGLKCDFQKSHKDQTCHLAYSKYLDCNFTLLKIPGTKCAFFKVVGLKLKLS